jgi:hypothetical protein
LNETVQDITVPTTTSTEPFNFGADVFAPLASQDFNLGGTVPNFIDPQVTTQPFASMSTFGMSQGPFTTSNFSLFPTASASPSSWATNPSSSFLDDYFLEVPLLKSYKAVSSIADILGISDELFTPTYRHTLQPIHDRPVPSWLQPTAAQQLIPHHPFIDLLPWPQVRTKLVIMFSMPDRQRPPVARGPMGVITMMHDMDDTTEGLRVMGENELDPNSWEVGQWFFSRWMFVLDSEVIKRSNELRDLRGAARLTVVE